MVFFLLLSRTCGSLSYNYIFFVLPPSFLMNSRIRGECVFRPSPDDIKGIYTLLLSFSFLLSLPSWRGKGGGEKEENSPREFGEFGAKKHVLYT